jgi:hypothetical protein
MTMSAELDSTEITRRMDVMIMLLLENGPDGAVSTTRKIEKLMSFGLTASEVARIIGKKPNYVTAVISGKKKPVAGKAGAGKVASVNE